MLNSGDQIGPYTLVEKIGKGSFGNVWLAERRTAITTTKVALKIPHDEDVDLDFVKQEADVWAQASGHQNVLPIIEANVYDDRVVIASEFAPDGSLETRLKESNGKAPSTESAVEVVSGVLAGLQHLHSRRIIHRDVKPANIIFQGDTPRLTDFGVSRMLKSTGQTTTSAGTPIYMAPEAFDGKRSVQTDIWSVGIIFYELLSGRLPFAFDDLTSLWKAVALNDLDPLPEDLPERLRSIVMKSLQRDTTLRYQSAAEMRADLKRFTSAERISETFDSAETLPSFRMPNDVPPTIRSVDTGLGDRVRKTTAIVVSLLLLVSIAALGVYFVPKLLGSQGTIETGNTALNTAATTPRDVATLFPSEWSGNWNSPTGSTYSAKVTLEKLDANDKCEGKIDWTLEDSKNPLRISKIGKQATELVRGEYNRPTNLLMMEGYRKTDPNDIISIDKYHLAPSADGKTIDGTTSNNGKWDAHFTLSRILGTVSHLSSDSSSEIVETVRAWIRALESRDIEITMSFYSSTVDYYTQARAPKSVVRADKQKAFDKYKNIQFTISDPVIATEPGSSSAEAVFDKMWVFKGESESAGKAKQALKFRKIDGQWLIYDERDWKVY